MNKKIEYGDWQTPFKLCQECVEKIKDFNPQFILEPTCGEGSFLEASAIRFLDAEIEGFEINGKYFLKAKDRVPRAGIKTKDFFSMNWKEYLSPKPEPVLVIGNPPWVTNSVQGKLDSDNLPVKDSQFEKGIENLLGKSNFDISESMVLTLLDALEGKEFMLCMILKTSVMRKIFEKKKREYSGIAYQIDTKKWFDVSVDSCFLVLSSKKTSEKWSFIDFLNQETIFHPNLEKVWNT